MTGLVCVACGTTCVTIESLEWSLPIRNVMKAYFGQPEIAHSTQFNLIRWPKIAAFDDSPVSFLQKVVQMAVSVFPAHAH